jgi:hypothetical protein
VTQMMKDAATAPETPWSAAPGMPTTHFRYVRHETEFGALDTLQQKWQIFSGYRGQSTIVEEWRDVPVVAVDLTGGAR